MAVMAAERMIADEKDRAKQQLMLDGVCGSLDRMKVN